MKSGSDPGSDGQLADDMRTRRQCVWLSIETQGARIGLKRHRSLVRSLGVGAVLLPTPHAGIEFERRPIHDRAADKAEGTKRRTDRAGHI